MIESYQFGSVCPLVPKLRDGSFKSRDFLVSMSLQYVCMHVCHASG